MKNSSKKNFSGKNNKQYYKQDDFGYYSKNTNRSKKNDRFLNKSPNNTKIDQHTRKQFMFIFHDKDTL